VKTSRTVVPSGHEDGASSVEYALLAVAIAAVIVAIVFALGEVTRDNFSGTCSSLKIKTGSAEQCTS